LPCAWPFAIPPRRAR